MLRPPRQIRLFHSVRFWMLAAAVAAMVAVLLVRPGPERSPEGGSAVLSTETPAAQPLGTTSFQIASFNLLGAGHTDGPNAPRKKFANSSKRLVWTRQLLDEYQIDLVGFQEMHRGQAFMWEANNPDWGTFPGTPLGDRPGQNSISWRSSQFTLIKSKTIKIPYFNGSLQRMPYVLLEHIASGQRLWIYNVHNPANIGGNHQKWRNQGFALANDLVNSLRAKDPDIPVFMTGDMNDREKFFCPTVAATGIAAANGGYASGSTCTPPRPMWVDWVMGSTPNTFTGYRALLTPLVKKTSDHPLIVATANIPSAAMQRNEIKNVVVVTVEGLRGNVWQRLGRQGKAPTVAALQRKGASTFKARTAYESTTPTPNLLSILTGRPVAAKNGGHGVKGAGGRRTVHQAAGGYVASTFDMVRNTGGRTALYSSNDSTDVVRRSWDNKSGGADPYGKDNGRNKITVKEQFSSDRATVRAFLQQKGKPAVYTHIHLGDPRRTGVATGFKGRAYRDAVTRFDRDLAIVRKAIRKNSTLKGRTLLIVTATGGGTGRSDTNKSARANYTVPLLIDGPGVPDGQDLYALNPGWTSPRGLRVNYSARPLNTAVVANLVLAVLRLPGLPGSSLNTDQAVNFLRLPAPLPEPVGTPSPSPGN